MLSRSTKFGYGLGGIVQGTKDAAFVMFLLFYYTQVLGLKASLAGLALMIGQSIDAVTDPIMGSVSDNFSSKYGRRHPFMLLAAIPSSVSLFALFAPVRGLGQIGLFVWLTAFVVLLHLGLTLYQVPFLALGAEISKDYVERTRLSAYRTTFGWFGMVCISGIAFATFFKKMPDYELGQMNPAAYPAFGVFCAAIALFAILASIALTLQKIPKLPQTPQNYSPFKLRRLVDELKMALRNPTFHIIATASILSGIIVGISTNLKMHMFTYFWEFTSEEMKMLSTGPMLAAILAFILIKAFERRDKQKVFIIICILSFFNSFAVILRLFGLLPPNGNPLVFKLVYIQTFFTLALAIMKITIVSSITADTVDEGELITNVRQEGIYFSFLSFTSKTVSGLGSLFAGLIIDFVKLPIKAEPGSVNLEVLWNLGFFAGPIVGLLHIFPLIIMLSPRLSMKRHQGIRAEIVRRKSEQRGLVSPMESA